MVTYDEFRWLKRLSNGKVRPEGTNSTARAIVGAAVAAEKLMASEEWQRYQTYLQDAINTIDTFMAHAHEQLGSQHMVKQDEIALIRQNLMDLQGRRTALEWALELPLDIQNAGEDARKLLEKPIKGGDAT